VIRRAFRLGLRLGLLIGLVMTVLALVRRRNAPATFGNGSGVDRWPARPEPPAPPRPLAAWVEPIDKSCPPTHPIKAKVSSNIFHAPGGVNYERTVPDRCYRDEAAALADGFVKSKR
jgi:hypothetical protein